MDIAVRYIPTQFMRSEDGRTVAAGNKPALCFVGSKEARCVHYADEGVEVTRLPPEVVLESPRPKGYEDDKAAISKFVTYFNIRLVKTAPKIDDEAYDLIKMVQDPPEDFDEVKPKRKSSPRAKRSKAPATKKAPSIINTLAEELKTTPPKVRKLLRSAGLNAPYDDEKKIRAAIKKANGATK